MNSYEAYEKRVCNMYIDFPRNSRLFYNRWNGSDLNLRSIVWFHSSITFFVTTLTMSFEFSLKKLTQALFLFKTPYFLDKTTQISIQFNQLSWNASANYTCVKLKCLGHGLLTYPSRLNTDAYALLIHARPIQTNECIYHTCVSWWLNAGE